MSNPREMILVQSRTPPTVEIDTAAQAVYVRFKRSGTRVVRTQHLDTIGSPIVTIDFDRLDEVIGIELIGVAEFSIGKLLQMAQVRAPHVDLDRARYVGAGRIQSEELAAAG